MTTRTTQCLATAGCLLMAMAGVLKLINHEISTGLLLIGCAISLGLNFYLIHSRGQPQHIPLDSPQSTAPTEERG